MNSIVYYSLRSNLRVILFFGPIVVPIANSTLSNGTREVILYFLRIEAKSALTVWRANLRKESRFKN